MRRARLRRTSAPCFALVAAAACCGHNFALAGDAAGSDAASADASSNGDSAVDAADAATCPSPGHTLMDDPANCGACGYAVIGDRTCTNGKPTPGWEPMAAPPSAFTTADYRFAAWTGIRMLVVKLDNAQLGYDPITDEWATMSGSAPFTPNDNLVGDVAVATLPTNNQLYVWATECSADQPYTPALLEFQDGATLAWSTLAQPPTDRCEPALLIVDGFLYAAFGGDPNNADNTDRYDLTGHTWASTSPAGTTSANFACAGGNGSQLCNNRSYNGRSGSPLVAVGSQLLSLGGETNGGGYADTDVHALDTSSFVWSDLDTSPSVPITSHTLVANQGRALIFGGNFDNTSANPPCMTAQVELIDPTTESVIAPAAPPDTLSARKSAWAFDLGNAIMIWGGVVTDCSNGSPEPQNGGAIASIDPSNDTVAWVALPAQNQPIAQFPGEITDAQGNEQRLWTGREAIVWGGYTGGTDDVSGSRYQPPVGCVCPSSQAICASVSDIADTTCDPTGQ